MQGRVHYYEGYDMDSVVLPIRLMGMLGAKFLILTNASGGISTRFRPGDLMMITDQISCLVPSPLRGENISELGKRFPDMSQIYDWELQKIIIQKALEENIDLKDGVYIQTQGPNYESPAEVNMCRLLGGDAVGMSTACEAVAANHMGLRIAGISCISNMAAGISPVALSEEEVIEAANMVSDKFTRLVTGLIEEIGKRY
jgi:purine-nucleoside phosphorylase